MKGLIVFCRVIGPDRILGPHFDNEYGQWGAVLMKDEIALKNFPYQEHDSSLEMALGHDWRNLEWLRSLLMRNQVLYELKR